jgi:hypothetical protein
MAAMPVWWYGSTIGALRRLSHMERHILDAAPAPNQIGQTGPMDNCNGSVNVRQSKATQI